MAGFVNVDQTNNNVAEQIQNFNVSNKQDLKIHVILDYTDFSGQDINDSLLTNVFEKYKSSKERMYNLSSKDQQPMLFVPNLTKEELETVLNKIKDKTEIGGSRKTKRSLPKHKKQKTEKKKG